MAVDSNVLIFERIREELRSGKSSSAALAAGFSKAFATLVDTHVTTVVSCIFLFFFGTSGGEGIRDHSGDRPDNEPVHIRIRFASSLRLGIVAEKTRCGIEHRNAGVDRDD